MSWDSHFAMVGAMSNFGIVPLIALVTLAGRRTAQNILAAWTGTLNEIIGAAVGALALSGAAYKGLKAAKKKRDSQRKQDEENRKLVEGLPSLIRDLNANMGQMSMRMANIETKVVSVDAGISANTGALSLQSIRLKDIETGLSYMKQRRAAELEEAGVCWFECDPEGKTTAVSQSLCDLFGMTEDQMLKDGTGWLLAIEGHNGPQWQSWMASVKDRIPYRDRYTIHNRRTGARIVVESTATRFEDKAGNTILFYGKVKPMEDNKP